MPAPHITAEQLIQHQDWLYRMVRQLVRDDFTADDMVQATMAEALADETAGTSNLRGWLGTTARRLTAQHWRSSSRRQHREGKTALRDEVALNYSSELSELFDIANRALYDLPEEERVAVMLRHMQGLKSSSIAKEMEIPLEKVYRHTENGTRKLRQRLEGRYGADWRSSCLAILAFRPGKAGTGMLTALTTAAACFTLLLGGFWSLDLLPEGRSDAHSDDGYQASIAGGGEEVGQGDFEGASPSRTDLVAPVRQSEELSVRVLSPEGRPVRQARVFLEWGRLSLESRDGLTDEDGIVSLPHPPDLTQAMLSGGSLGLFGRTIEIDPSTLSDTLEYSLVEGTQRVGFHAPHSREGDVLEVIGGSDFGAFRIWRAYCVTDEQGRAELLVPANGRYMVRAEQATPQWSSPSFYVGVPELTGSILVPFDLPRSCSLVAQDAGRDTVLDEAIFTTNPFTPDSRTRRKLPSDRGFLDLTSDLPDFTKESIRVGAEGYQDMIVQMTARYGDTTPVPLQRLEWVPARVTLGDPARRISTLVLKDSIGRMKIPLAEGSSPILWQHGQEMNLELDEHGSFLLPRTVEPQWATFRLRGEDDLGQVWISGRLGREERYVVDPHFVLHREAMGETTVHLSGAHAPSTGHEFAFSSVTQSNGWDRPIEPDENGFVHAQTLDGEQIQVKYFGPGLTWTVRPQLPAGAPEGHFVSHLPAGDATLAGSLYGPRGLPLPDGTPIVALYLGPAPVMGPGASEDAVLEYHGRVEGGRLVLEDCPSGEYLIELNFRGASSTWEVSTYEDFELNFPSLHILTNWVQDAETGEGVQASLYDTSVLLETGFPNLIGRTDDTSGFHSHAFLEHFDRSHLLCAAHGYEPFLVGHLLSDRIEVVRLTPGRSVFTAFEELGIDAVTGNSWICDAWGTAQDPRQPLIRSNQDWLRNDHAPKEAFTLLEVDATGTTTGRAIRVHEDGRFEVL